MNAIINTTPDNTVASKQFVKQFAAYLATACGLNCLAVFAFTQIVGVQRAIEMLSSNPALVWAPVASFLTSVLIAKLWRSPAVSLMALPASIVLASIFFLFKIDGVATSQVIELIKWLS